MRGRSFAGCLGLMVLVPFAAAGCSQVVSGTAAPDPVVAKIPRMTPDQIPNVLLTTAEMNPLVSSSTLTQKFENTSPTTPNFTYDQPTCGPMVYTGDSDTYGDQWNGYRLRSYREPGDNYDHAIFQTVTTFANFLVAEDLVAKYRDILAQCQNKDILNTPKDPKDGNPSTLHITQVAHNSDPSADSVDWTTGATGDTWVCSDTMRTEGNVVIEVSSCANSDARTAAVIADRIAAKIQQQS
ncbi:sensor domain-containing protein [Nocardia sp. NPDC020380]|uniref:sensor domain-containing protein n=1 Tax=Nocardia sp. NPDC020380 TaxID=3364309 RepID=UPI0037AFF0A6